MLAIFKTGGKQYSVKAGQILKVEKLEGNKGDSISFNKVLAVSEKSNNTIAQMDWYQLRRSRIYTIKKN